MLHSKVNNLKRYSANHLATISGILFHKFLDYTTTRKLLIHNLSV